MMWLFPLSQAQEGWFTWKCNALSPRSPGEEELVTHLGFLSRQQLHLALLPDGELIAQHFGASGDGDLELIPILHDFRNALHVLALLDLVIRKPCTGTGTLGGAMGGQVAAA